MWFNKHGHEMDLIRHSQSTYADSIVKANKASWVGMGMIYSTKNTNISLANHQPPLLNVITNPGGGIPPEQLILLYYNIATPTVGPLLVTHWSQDNPFNYYSPIIDNVRTPAGCVPVAMGQIMNFWGWPSNYNWNLMPKDGFDPPVGTYEAARLLHDIGTTSVPIGAYSAVGLPIPVDLQFVHYGNGDDGSTASDAVSPNVFAQFGYSSTRSQSYTTQYISGGQNGVTYAGIITDEVFDNHRPCMVGGFPGQSWYLVYVPDGTGHEWVCDGSQKSNWTPVYQDIIYNPITHRSESSIVIGQMFTQSRYLHMNWGWGGGSGVQGGTNNDGWYNAEVNYTSAPKPGNSTDYSYFQTVIYNIHR